jgi:hypothetical protein
MALRLLPFRQYDEQDVVNIYALESGLALAATTDDGSGSNGVFVKVLLQAVLPGQTVPVATKGIFTLSANAFENALSTNQLGVGSGIAMATGAASKGKLTGIAPGSATSFGTVIGTGSRAATNGGLSDQFAGEFIVIKLG